ncbi:MAG: hypothetical protein JKY41_12330, partial [Rhodobacteraceae bacterium]|nr:hypothetical protein [Paracoccaceae bacterium]
EISRHEFELERKPILSLSRNEEVLNLATLKKVMTSGDGGVFPSDILIGQVAIDPEGHFRVRLAADHENLDFIRVLKVTPREDIGGSGDIIGVAAGVGE